MVPQLCVSCPTSPTNNFTDFYPITLNNTETLLRGKFWNYDQFYNHTGVDLILSQEKWLWNPSGKILLYDEIILHRSTWGDNYDFDLFYTTTSSYSSFNKTHVLEKWAVLERWAYDIGDLEISSHSGEEYLFRV